MLCENGPSFRIAAFEDNYPLETLALNFFPFLMIPYDPVIMLGKSTEMKVGKLKIAPFFSPVQGRLRRSAVKESSDSSIAEIKQALLRCYRLLVKQRYLKND